MPFKCQRHASLWDQQQLACASSCLEIAMRARSITQFVHLLDAQPQRSLADLLKNGPRPFLQFFPRGDVMAERRPGQENGALLR